MLRPHGRLLLTLALAAVSACGTSEPSGASEQTGGTADLPNVLYDFTTQAAAANWAVQNDTVMGGASESSSNWVNKQLVFTGNLSLENNGGFVSCFGPVDEKLPSLVRQSTAIRIRATGDGKTYLFQLRGNNGTNYVQRFTSTAKKDQVYVLPLPDFTAVDWRLEEIADAPAIATANIYQMGIYLVDQQTGPFRIAITSIDITSE
jgi:NADH dehydrogenase [ubiquinone] 1 alpha subcomplex assembly factor 1